MKTLNLKDYILAAMFAALTFALAFLLGAGIILASGIPATGGIANIFVAVFILIIALKMVPKFAFGTLTLGLVFFFAIPTVIGGPPGMYKVVNGVLIGFTADFILLVGKRTKIAHIVAGSVGAVVSIVSIYVAMLLMGLPGVDRLASLVWPLSALQAVLGAVAAWLAVTLFDRRLSHLASVRRIMAQ